MERELPIRIWLAGWAAVMKTVVVAFSLFLVHTVKKFLLTSCC